MCPLQNAALLKSTAHNLYKVSHGGASWQEGASYRGSGAEGKLGQRRFWHRHVHIICTAADGCTDENTMILLFVVSLLHGEAGERSVAG